MKRALIFIITIFIGLVVVGCKPNDEKSTNYRTGILKDDDNINYRVDQILLSKSFQSIEPSIEVTNKKNTTRVLASLGLTESSGVKVNKLVRRGREVDIHVSGIYEETDLQLAVPQVVLEIKKPRFSKTGDLKFNIVNDDYRPLKIKLGINEVISKVQSHFKISSNGTPIVNLTRLNDNILWNISYDSIFDRENPQIPLINLSASIDANSGDILESKKTFISSSIDEGHILDYKSNQHILYKKPIKGGDSEEAKDQLWSYNLSTREKTMLFSSNLKILSAKYSRDLSYVSLIETSEKGSELYIIPREDQKAYKISFEDVFNPKIMNWQDDDRLYLIENDNEHSIVFSYDVKENLTNRVARVNKDIQNLIIKEDTFLIVENLEDSYNHKISTTFDWKDFTFIDYGFNPSFIGVNNLGYLKKNEKSDTDSLLLYSIENERNINIIDENISTFQVLSDEDITYVTKNPNYNNFTLSSYSLKDKTTVDIADLVGDRVYYDTERDIIYVNISLPFENDKSEIIYLIDLAKLN